MNKPKSKIIGIGHYAPPKVVTNDDLAKVYGIDTSDEWIQQRSGIQRRHYVEGGIGASDLALKACENAIKNANIKKEEIDCILFATLSPDHDFPGAGCFLQAKLGLTGIPAIDIRNQCSGFIYGLTLANSLIASGQYKTVLVVGAEVHSTGIDLTTRGRDVAVLFGDGAGAAIVTKTDGADGRGILSCAIHADGNYAKELWLEAPSCAHQPRITKEMLDEGKQYPHMNGKVVFVHAVRKMPEVMMEVLNSQNLKVEDLDLFVPHQANIRINEAVAKGLGISESKCFNTIHEYGNTTAATIPIGLSEAVNQEKLKPGMLVGVAAFGSGFTWAAALIRW